MDATARRPCKLVTPANIVRMFIVRSQELMRAAHYPPYDHCINDRMSLGPEDLGPGDSGLEDLGYGGVGESVVLRS